MQMIKVGAYYAKKSLKLSIFAMGLLWLAGCAHQDLKAPCPNFGSTCSQENINSWN